MEKLANLISNYLITAKLQKKLSPHTIKAYRIDLYQFAEYVQGQLAETETLREYVIYLNNHFSPRSAKRKLASVRAFYSELWASGIIDHNPFDKLRISIHSPQQVPRIIPEETVNTLLQCAYKKYRAGARTTLRDIVVLELLFSTGLRVSELCSLSHDNFDLKENSVRLFAQNHEEKNKKHQRDAHEQAHRVNVRCNLPGIEFRGQKARPPEKQPQCTSDFRIELIYIFKILEKIFPERLSGIHRILAAFMAIHSLQFRSAVLAVPVRRNIVLPPYPFQPA